MKERVQISDSWLKKKTNVKKFDQILLESIDEALSTIGKRAKEAIYHHLKHNFSISKQDIPRRVNDFSTAIEQIFGETAQHIEILIMKCLQKKVKGSYEWNGPKWLVPDLTFVKYVNLMRVSYEDTERADNVEVILDLGEQVEQRI
jgi:hypothetical protein